MGLTIEAENAQEQSAARAAVSKRKKDPGYSLEISSIHRRVKEMMKSRAAAPEAATSTASKQAYQTMQDPEIDLQTGCEARKHETSRQWPMARSK